MPVLRSSDRQTKVQPPANFTGVVFSDEIVQGSAPSRMRASVVSFTPGGRTAWHSHPVGQTLYCLSGAGRVQFEGQPVQELHPGDTVMIPPAGTFASAKYAGIPKCGASEASLVRCIGL